MNKTKNVLLVLFTTLHSSIFGHPPIYNPGYAFDHFCIHYDSWRGRGDTTFCVDSPMSVPHTPSLILQNQQHKTSLHDVRGANVQDGAFNYTKPKTESSLEFGFIKTVTPGLMKKQGNKFKISLNNQKCLPHGQVNTTTHLVRQCGTSLISNRKCTAALIFVTNNRPKNKTI